MKPHGIQFYRAIKDFEVRRVGPPPTENIVGDGGLNNDPDPSKALWDEAHPRVI